jgi:16S rRNA (adenine1518-N6/adenine1519-N6)-dimethyltransferase
LDGQQVVVMPKKSLGQHWLYDKDVLTDIVDLAEVKSGEVVVEIGPGLGTLTEVLLEYDANVTAIEFDSTLASDLVKNNLSKNLKVINQDILKFDFTKLPDDYKVVANIPYYLTSNLIRIFTESSNKPALVVMLVQKEVAQRVCASEGQMSLLSVWAQMNFECSLGPIVPAKLFTPPPKVDSQVVAMNRLDKIPYKADDRKTLKQLLKAGFSNKRKTLHNSLSAGMHITKDQSKELLEGSGVSAMARPQDLSIDDWIRLSNTLNKLSIV